MSLVRSRLRTPAAVFTLRFLLALALIAVASILGVLRPSVDMLTVVVGYISYSLLGIFDAGLVLEGGLLSSPEASLRVTDACSGSDVLGLLFAGVVALPTRVRVTIAGLALMTAIVIVVNSLRVISLYLILGHVPAAFDFFHGFVWQALLVLISVGAWAYWAQRVLARANDR